MKLIAFDMDGTLIRNTDSVTFLCQLQQAPPKALAAIDLRENAGSISWIDADYERAKLIQGLPIQHVIDSFDTDIQIIRGLDTVMSYLRNNQYATVLITAGPRQVADRLAERYHFDDCFGSDFEVIQGIFTGHISFHMGAKGKSECLKTVCRSKDISYEDCIAVGDSSSDIDLFQLVGCAIAINYSPDLKQYATYSINTEDLTDILPFLSYSQT